jgi:hypothetical protein
MRDPSRIESETVSGRYDAPEQRHREESSRHISDKTKPSTKSKESERKSRTGFNKRLLKNRLGEEQCFEEARATAKSYSLVVGTSMNVNLFFRSSQHENSSGSLMELDDDGEYSADMSTMETSTVSVPLSVTSQPTSSKLQVHRSESKERSSRGFQRETSFEMGLNQTAISTASSTINEAEAVGVPGRRDEETINTKLAMRELSMMFSSPAVGSESVRKRNSLASVINESIEGHQDQSFENLADGLGNVRLDNSIFHSSGGQQSTPAAGKSSASPKADSGGGGFGFRIYDEDLKQNDSSSSSPPPAPSNGFAFSIFQDEDLTDPPLQEKAENQHDNYNHGTRDETADLADVMELFGNDEEAKSVHSNRDDNTLSEQSGFPPRVSNNNQNTSGTTNSVS